MTATASPGSDTGDRPSRRNGEMTIVEHLTELRSRLFKSLVALALGFGVGFVLRGYVLDIIREPYCRLPADVRSGAAAVSGGDECALIVLQVLDGLVISIKLAAIVAVIVAAPVVFYQILRFVMPGLKPVEKRWAVPFLLAGWVLFITGALFAYFVIPRGLELLLSFAGPGITPVLSAREYVDFMLFTVVAFGLSFEFPLVLTVLVLTGVVGVDGLRRYRRHAVFLIFLASAIITPTGDPFTMSAMALPLIVFYELIILLARFKARRARRAGEA